MTIHESLLSLASDMSRLDPTRPKQATLRRAVSTAYYALFHLLVDAASRIYVRTDEVRIARIARTFDHAKMYNASRAFLNNQLPEGLMTSTAYQTPDDLKTVAEAFINLQQKRHDADYNLARTFTRSETEELVDEATRAFAAWDIVRNSDEARLYLACFLLWDTWKKPAR